MPVIEEEETKEVSGQALGAAASKPRPYSAVPKQSSPFDYESMPLDFVELTDPSARTTTYKVKLKRPQTAVARTPF